MLSPVLHFIDDWLSREQGWMRVALLPTQIEVTILSFLNGKIFGGPWLNCMLKNTEQGNGSRERSIHQRSDYHHSQCIYPFSLCCSTRIERPNLSNFRVFTNKHDSSSWLNCMAFWFTGCSFQPEEMEQPVPWQWQLWGWVGTELRHSQAVPAPCLLEVNVDFCWLGR